MQLLHTAKCRTNALARELSDSIQDNIDVSTWLCGNQFPSVNHAQWSAGTTCSILFEWLSRTNNISPIIRYGSIIPKKKGVECNL